MAEPTEGNCVGLRLRHGSCLHGRDSQDGGEEDAVEFHIGEVEALFLAIVVVKSWGFFFQNKKQKAKVLIAIRMSVTKLLLNDWY